VSRQLHSACRLMGGMKLVSWSVIPALTSCCSPAPNETFDPRAMELAGQCEVAKVLVQINFLPSGRAYNVQLWCYLPPVFQDAAIRRPNACKRNLVPHSLKRLDYSQCTSRTAPTGNQLYPESTASKPTPTTSGAAPTRAQIRVDHVPAYTFQISRFAKSFFKTIYFTNGTAKTRLYPMSCIWVLADRSLSVRLMAKGALDATAIMTRSGSKGEIIATAGFSRLWMITVSFVENFNSEGLGYSAA